MSMRKRVVVVCVLSSVFCLTTPPSAPGQSRPQRPQLLRAGSATEIKHPLKEMLAPPPRAPRNADRHLSGEILVKLRTQSAADEVLARASVKRQQQKGNGQPAQGIDGLLNRLQGNIDQLADIFTGRVVNWKELGGVDAPIVLLSRETNSGTHVYFLEEVVRKGDADSKDIFAPQTLLMPSSVGITSELRRNPNAIGYDGLGYVDPAHEKLIAVAADSNSPYIMPSVATGMDGSYPIARPLYMYTAGQPAVATADYLNWIMGPQGQEIVAELGFVPLSAQ